MALPALASFGAMLALTAAASTVYTPPQIIADAAVMAASSHVSLGPPQACRSPDRTLDQPPSAAHRRHPRQPGDYGRLRAWASLSWSAFAPLAGWVNSTFGLRVGIMCFVVGSLAALPAAAMLPVEALRREVRAWRGAHAAAGPGAGALLPLSWRQDD